LNSILHLHTSNQEASTGWARPRIIDTKTPNCFLLYNKFEFAGTFLWLFGEESLQLNRARASYCCLSCTIQYNTILFYYNHRQTATKVTYKGTIV